MITFDSLARGMEIVEGGGAINYDGLSGTLHMDATGNVDEGLIMGFTMTEAGEVVPAQ